MLNERERWQHIANQSENNFTNPVVQCSNVPALNVIVAIDAIQFIQ